MATGVDSLSSENLRGGRGEWRRVWLLRCSIFILVGSQCLRDAKFDIRRDAVTFSAEERYIESASGIIIVSEVENPAPTDEQTPDSTMMTDLTGSTFGDSSGGPPAVSKASIDHWLPDNNNNNSASLLGLSSSVCKEKGGDKLLQYDKNTPFPHELSSIFRGLGVEVFQDPNITRAICIVDDLSFNWVHTLQQLYPCISFWQAAPRHQKRVLLNREGKQPKHWPPFILRIVEYLKSLFDVSVVKNGDADLGTNYSTVEPITRAGWDLDGEKMIINAYDVLKPRHMNVLRDRIVRHVHANNNASKTHTLNTCTAAPPPRTASSFNHNTTRRRVPRIRILNREGTRTIKNANELAKTIHQRLGIPADVAYFEDTDFDFQVGTMADTDILISPHGAQLGSLPFLPDCSQVLELFPAGYWIPGFYGSLAHAGGSEYQYLYLGDGDMRNVTKFTTRTIGGRIIARKQKLCAPLEASVNAVDQMVRNWHSCCNRIDDAPPPRRRRR